LTERLISWVSTRPEIRALAMVGSWARQKPTEDSDFDIVLLTGEPERFTMTDDWLEVLINPPVIRREQFRDITERRVQLPSGLQVEFGIGSPEWVATNPVDAGTKRVGIREVFPPICGVKLPPASLWRGLRIARSGPIVHLSY
jgi:hypothetical protein